DSSGSLQTPSDKANMQGSDPPWNRRLLSRPSPYLTWGLRTAGYTSPSQAITSTCFPFRISRGRETRNLVLVDGEGHVLAQSHAQEVCATGFRPGRPPREALPRGLTRDDQGADREAARNRSPQRDTIPRRANGSRHPAFMLLSMA